MNINITSSSTKPTEAVKTARLSDNRALDGPKTDSSLRIEPPVKEEEASKASAVPVPEPPEKKAVKAEIALREKVQLAVENVRDFINKNQRSLDFQMAEESNRVIITVIDRTTNEVIRQIPPEDVVKMSDSIMAGDQSVTDGLLFSGKA